jgi:ribokinase
VAPRLAVVGSVNVDLVARCERLPRPGETVTGASFDRFFGGKGANQAVAAARLGATTRMVACVGDDDNGREAVAALAAEGVDTGSVTTGRAPTGIALIVVAGTGSSRATRSTWTESTRCSVSSRSLCRRSREPLA